MTTYYKATFSGGQVQLRSTDHRQYTHAVGPGRGTSFCGSLALAQKEAATRSGKPWYAGCCEIAEAVETSAKEYRQLKGAQHAGS